MKWKRITLWSSAILLALILVVAVAASIIVRTAAFHRYVLAKIVQQAHDATGATVEIHNFDFRLSGLTADLYGVTLHGTEGANERPLLRVDKITVGLKILSVLRHQVNLSNLEIDHPVASVIVAKDGRSNLPQPPAAKNSSSSTNVFDLAVGHVLLANGELYYNDKQSSMDADVRDLRTEINYTMLSAKYNGTISYHDGRIRYGALSPLPHALNAKFTAGRSGLSFDQLDLTLGSSHVSVQANVTDYNNPKLDGNYNIVLHTQDAADLLTGPSVAGDVALAGSLHYTGLIGQPLLQNVSTDGHIESNGLALNNPQGHVELRKIQGRYQLANGNFQAKDIIVNLLRGELRAALEMQHLDTTPRSKLHVSLRGISLEAARNAITASSAKQLPLTGNVEGTADASWNGNLQGLQVRSDARIHGAIFNAGGGRSPSSPVP
ncbi:MAG: AsmA family protein, partial [Acidobacteriales bacterium]|nr:AsmA family protein [Terriglobales bacterium]